MFRRLRVLSRLLCSCSHNLLASTKDLVCGIVPSSAHMQHASTVDLMCGVVPSSAHMQPASKENVVCDIIPSYVHMQPASKKDLVCGIYRGFRVWQGNVRRTCSRHLPRSGVRHYSVFCAHAAGIYEGSGVQHLQRIWCAAWYCSAHM